MAAYLVRRLAFSVFVLWGAVTIIFLVLRLVPGDPALLILGSDATPEQVAALRAQLGFDRPLLVQYGAYLADVAMLDFGESFRFSAPAMTLVLERLPATVELSVVALSLSLVVGIPLGIIAALRVNTATDRIITTLSLLGQSMPAFWVGIVCILVFSRWLQVLPSAGTGSPAHMVLPAVTLALPFMVMLVRLTRGGLLEVIHEGYVQTARSKGLTERVVIFPHAIRNALIPIVTVVGVKFGSLLSGAVIIETVFAWPGVGRLLVDAISHRDYAVVQASVLLIAAGFVLINLAVDVLYGYLDPRVRLVGTP